MARIDDDASPLSEDIARLLELSDERDQWERLRDAAYRDGWQAGHDTGWREGYRRAAADWKVTVTNTGWRGPSPAHAELDRRRYPPGGRLSWLQPRLGDLYLQWQQHCEHDDDTAAAAA